MVDKDQVKSELSTVESNVRVAPHAHRRAQQRNVDVNHVKRKLENLDIEDAKANDDNDTRYEKTYKILIKKDSDTYYTAPVHFNMHGNEIYVKSLWQE